MNTTFLTEFIQWAFNKFYVSMEKTRNMGAVQNGDKSYTGARRPDFFLSKKMRLNGRQYTNQCHSGQRRNMGSKIYWAIIITILVFGIISVYGVETNVEDSRISIIINQFPPSLAGSTVLLKNAENDKWITQKVSQEGSFTFFRHELLRPNTERDRIQGTICLSNVSTRYYGRSYEMNCKRMFFYFPLLNIGDELLKINYFIIRFPIRNPQQRD